MAEVDEGILAADDQERLEAEFSLKKKKPKKPKKKPDATDEKTDTGEGESAEKVGILIDGDHKENAENNNVNTFDPPSYDYLQLLNRVVECIHEKNPELAEKKRFTMKPPQLMRVGTKKTLWANFPEICTMMRRSSDHVFQFMIAELGTEGSIDGNKRFVIKGKFAPKYIESLLRKYIVEYVACQMCRSFNTNLTRDSVSRLYFVSCQDCGSSRSVAPIRAGFHAQTRADRRALRNAP